MAGRAVRVDGAAETQRDLAQLRDQVSRSGEADGEAAQLVANVARGIGPNRSGALAGSYAGWPMRDRAEVRSSLPYAGVIEQGWPGHNIAAQRRVQRAFERSTAQVEAIYSRWLDSEIERA
jgi:hypothetical protein